MEGMEHLSMCRICLATDVQLCSVASNLQHMYERITAMAFKREDRSPLEACYICHAKLQNCYRLRKICLRSADLLTRMQSSGVLALQEVSSTNTFGVVSVLHLSLEPVLQDSMEIHIKKEAPEGIHDTELNQHYLEDMKMEPKEEHCSQIDDDIQWSHLENPVDVITKQSDDDETDNEDIKLEIGDTIIEEKKPIGAGPSSQSADNIRQKIVNVDFERISVKMEPQEEHCSQIDDGIQYSHLKNPVDVITKQSDDNETGVLAIKKLAETDSHLVTKPENKKNVFDKLVPVSNIHETVYKVEAILHKHRDNTIIADYKVHQQTSKSNICSIKKSFGSKAHLKGHTRKHTDEKRFHCNVCQKRLNSKRTLIQHMFIHTGEKRFQCEMCNKCFSSKRYLTHHMYTHTDEKRFQCNVCHKCLNSKRTLIEHMYTHTGEKRFPCEMCSKSFSCRRNLTDHMFTHTGEKRFQCDVCNKCLSSKRSLTQHMSKHTNLKRFPCDVCNKCLSSKVSLIRHMYTHTGNKQFKCDVCNKYLTSKRNLIDHMNIHTGEEQFQCDVCYKYLSNKRSLIQHMYKHTGGKRFQCDVCNKCLSNKRSLIQHMYQHTCETRFQCDVCNKCLTSKRNLTEHMYRHSCKKQF